MNNIANKVAVMSFACVSVLGGCSSTTTEIALPQTEPLSQQTTSPEDSRKSLLVNVDPPDSTIRIMNIVPKYVPGLLLEQGDYHLRVSRKGYHTYDTWVQLQSNETLSISLNKVEITSDKADPLSKAGTNNSHSGPQFDVEIITKQSSEVSGLQRIAMERDCELLVARVKANSVNGQVAKQAYPAGSFPEANEAKIIFTTELHKLSPQKNESWSQVPLMVKAWDVKNDKEPNSTAINRGDFVNCTMLEEQESLLSITHNKTVEANSLLAGPEAIIAKKLKDANNLDLSHQSLTVNNRDVHISQQTKSQSPSSFMTVYDDNKVDSAADNYAVSRAKKLGSEQSGAVEQNRDPKTLKGLSTGSILYNGEQRIFATLEDAMSIIYQAPISNPIGIESPATLDNTQ